MIGSSFQVWSYTRLARSVVVMVLHPARGLRTSRICRRARKLTLADRAAIMPRSRRTIVQRARLVALRSAGLGAPVAGDARRHRLDDSQHGPRHRQHRVAVDPDQPDLADDLGLDQADQARSRKSANHQLEMAR